MHLPHFFDFVKVYYEASLVGMVLFDAFSAEYSEVVGAIKVLDPLVMFVAKQTLYAVFILKVDVP
jgi:hypothetical protein